MPLTSKNEGELFFTVLNIVDKIDTVVPVLIVPIVSISHFSKRLSSIVVVVVVVVVVSVVEIICPIVAKVDFFALVGRKGPRDPRIDDISRQLSGITDSVDQSD